MSKVKIQGNASGTGVVTLTAPNTNTDRTITLPDDTQTLIGTNASGNVGIGTSSPSANLHISSSGDTIARITSADGNGAFLDLGDASDPDGGRIVYDSGSNLGFSTASTERMRINSAGNVGIGTTSPDEKLEVIGQALIGSGTDGLKFTYSAGNSTGIIDTGFTSTAIELRVANSEKARITANGLTFNGDTAAANALDDYEEGTWTPTFTAATSSPTITYNTNSGTYTKIGNMVTANGIIITNTSSGGSGHMRIDGLPFTHSNLLTMKSTCNISFSYNWFGTNPQAAMAVANTSYANLYTTMSSNTSITPADLHSTGNDYLYFSITYQTDA